MKTATVLRTQKTRAANARAFSGKQVPVIVEKGEDGYYIVECPVLEGCYSQGKTIDDALRNIREVIDLVLEEKQARKALKDYHPAEISLHTITL